MITTCIILDDSYNIPRWQFEALSLSIKQNQIEVVLLLKCKNNRSRKTISRNFLYYVMRATTMRLPASLEERDIRTLRGTTYEELDFEALYSGNWQIIPDDLIRQIRSFDIEVCIKFGMGLLKAADAFPSTYGVLSFHHGDPAKYRGRPAGFYELQADEDSLGAMVQKLSDNLDAGEIFAIGRFKVIRHSYAKSLNNLYSGSSYLLKTAIDNLVSASPLRHSVKGKNYHLPDNLTVFYFWISLTIRKLQWLIYGLFYQKQWQVGVTEVKDYIFNSGDFEISEFTQLQCPSNYEFIADCFFSKGADSSIICEGFNQNTKKGEIIEISLDTERVVSTYQLTSPSHHCSYPFVFLYEGTQFLLPEISSSASPRLFEISAGNVKSTLVLKGLENLRLVDPSIIYHEKKFWLFAGIPYADDRLHLWSTSDLTKPFIEHQQSPVLLNPNGARQGGIVKSPEGSLYRVGQNNSADYGDGLSLYRVDALTPTSYEEELTSRITIKGFKGPHTLDIKGDQMLFDYYRVVFNPLAFVSRIINRLF